MRKKTKLISGIALLLLAAALITFVIIDVKANIPPVSLDNGPGTLAQYKPPFEGAGLVMVIMFLLGIISGLGGVIMIILGTQGER